MNLRPLRDDPGVFAKQGMVVPSFKKKTKNKTKSVSPSEISQGGSFLCLSSLMWVFGVVFKIHFTEVFV